MKRLVALLPAAVAAAAVAAPAVSSAAGTTAHPAKKAPVKAQFRGHEGPCPFADSGISSSADL
jgi:hypothetical protein